LVEASSCSSSAGTLVLGSRTPSKMAGMLLRLTVSAREIIDMANVAFKRGSSQQGKARLAAVGCVITRSDRTKGSEN
jgi:hypothetical protein